MADKPIREQSAMELLETHAKALETENARLRAEVEAKETTIKRLADDNVSQHERLQRMLSNPLRQLDNLERGLHLTAEEQREWDADKKLITEYCAVITSMTADVERLRAALKETAQTLRTIADDIEARYVRGELLGLAVACERDGVETESKPPREIWACVSKGISPPYVRFFESKAEMEAYEWRDDSVSPNRYRPAEKAAGDV